MFIPWVFDPFVSGLSSNLPTMPCWFPEVLLKNDEVIGTRKGLGLQWSVLARCDAFGCGSASLANSRLFSRTMGAWAIMRHHTATTNWIVAIHAPCISDACPGKPVLPLSLDQKIAVIGEAAMIMIELYRIYTDHLRITYDNFRQFMQGWGEIFLERVALWPGCLFTFLAGLARPFFPHSCRILQSNHERWHWHDIDMSSVMYFLSGTWTKLKGTSGLSIWYNSDISDFLVVDTMRLSIFRYHLHR